MFFMTFLWNYIVEVKSVMMQTLAYLTEALVSPFLSLAFISQTQRSELTGKGFREKSAQPSTVMVLHSRATHTNKNSELIWYTELYTLWKNKLTNVHTYTHAQKNTGHKKKKKSCKNQVYSFFTPNHHFIKVVCHLNKVNNTWQENERQNKSWKGWTW